MGNNELSLSNMFTLPEKTLTLMTPKIVYIGNHLNKGYPNTSEFTDKGHIYLGPAVTWHIHAEKESKWFHRDSYWTRPDTGVNGLEVGYFAGFSIDKYTEYIESNLWDQIPELYGRIVGCWCKECECACQARVLADIVQKRVYEEWKLVNKEQFVELKEKYMLKFKDLAILEKEIFHTERSYRGANTRFDDYMRAILPCPKSLFLK